MNGLPVVTWGHGLEKEDGEGTGDDMNTSNPEKLFLLHLRTLLKLPRDDVVRHGYFGSYDAVTRALEKMEGWNEGLIVLENQLKFARQPTGKQLVDGLTQSAAARDYTKRLNESPAEMGKRDENMALIFNAQREQQPESLSNTSPVVRTTPAIVFPSRQQSRDHVPASTVASLDLPAGCGGRLEASMPVLAGAVGGLFVLVLFFVWV